MITQFIECAWIASYKASLSDEPANRSNTAAEHAIRSSNFYTSIHPSNVCLTESHYHCFSTRVQHRTRSTQSLLSLAKFTRQTQIDQTYQHFLSYSFCPIISLLRISPCPFQFYSITRIPHSFVRFDIFWRMPSSTVGFFWLCTTKSKLPLCLHLFY